MFDTPARGFGYSWPHQTPPIKYGVYPTNHLSQLSCVVPVLPAVSTYLSKVTAFAVPWLTTFLSMSVIIEAVSLLIARTPEL